MEIRIFRRILLAAFSIKTNNDFCQIIGHRYRPIIAKTYLIE